ncbi:PAS domain S-box protein [Halobaculum sp. CBA1158]|nr:PAS domain S-box protein [Halobaculum sp. CBA1158]UIP01217.1 PAS domain S-box protein [Halobaculum sp. CBA1158]
MTGGDFEAALERIAETAAAVLEVPRVNVWLFDDGHDTLRCVEDFDRSSGTHQSGMTLEAGEYPAYLEALESSRSIVADDPLEDPRTAGLEDYLVEHDVGSLLDATIRSGGDVLGVVCHEHVGGPRRWTDDEVEFASDIAELVHRAHRNRERTERTAELERTRARFRALTDNTTHAIVTIDDESTVRYANDAVEDILGYAPEELVGDSLERIVPDRLREPHREGLARYLQTGAKGVDWDWVELPGLHRDGHEVRLGISFGETTVDGEPRFTAVVRDISDRTEDARDPDR